MTAETATGRADLHIHSVASDGTADVSTILDHVAARGELDVIAITDHERIDAALAAPGDGPGPRARARGHRRRGGHDPRRAPARACSSTGRSGRTAPCARPSPTSMPPEASPIPAHPLVPYPLCAQAWVLRRLLDDPDESVHPDAIETFNPTALGRPWHDRVVRFADAHRLAHVGNSDAHALDAIGTGWTTFPGRTADDLRRAIAAGQTEHGGAFHGVGGQFGVFGQQLAKRARDARDEVGRPRPSRRHGSRPWLPRWRARGRRATTRRPERTMKIGLVCPYIYPDNGGVAQHVRFLYENLRLRGHDVRILTASHGPQRASEGDIIRLGVGFSRADQRRRSARSRSRRATSARSGRCWNASSSTCSTSTSRSCRSCRCSSCANRPASTSPPSTPTPASRRRTSSAAGCWAATRRGSTAGSRSAPRPATSSTASSRATTRSSPTASTSPRYANAVPLARWQDGTPNVLFVGRHEPRKGLLDLLKAHRILRKTGSATRLLVVGSGPQEREARRYVATRALQGVEFLGRVSDAEKAQLFRTADVYASPATGGESFGIVLLEAMAAGAPIVVLATSTATRASSGAAAKGLLVPPRGPEANWPRPSTGCSRPRAARRRWAPPAGPAPRSSAGRG